jgi:16S rRNA (guanine527-N7)-methyltransferase
VLLDSTRKKCDWLRDAIDVLQLPNVDVVWDRAELAAHRPEMRARFDLVVARAVARLAVLAELALPFVRVGGFFLAPKECFVEALPSCGGHWPELDSAMRAIALNGGRYELTAPSAPTLEQNEQISTNSNKTRVVVVIQKVEHTPLVYPRAPGRPQSQPL